ncbi:hypothetical protein [Paenarthrobacter aromaticivorans]|uniref:hypothetical protein n=1 Tax=Paenarthrobacter aromaticivorans TaxID=2849150 RepID=UPI003A802BC9
MSPTSSFGFADGPRAAVAYEGQNSGQAQRKVVVELVFWGEGLSGGLTIANSWGGNIGGGNGSGGGASINFTDYYKMF